MGEWGGGCGGEVVGGAVDSEGGECACYFGFWGAFVGAFGELFEFALGGGGGGEGDGGGAGDGAGDGGVGWGVVF